MKFFIALCLHAVVFNIACSMPMLQGNNLGPCATNKPGINTFANGPIIANEPVFNMNYIPNNLAAGNTILANEALSTNLLANANTVLANEMFGNAIISSANFIPLANLPSGFSMTPIISEIVPSLQYGDITMAGDLPVGGTIKVCGCFPVYGMITVDGSVPSAGTAVVADAFGNPIRM